MPKKKRESKASYELTKSAYEAVWLGGAEFKDMFKDWSTAWARLLPALAKRNPIPWYNTFWDLSPNIPPELWTLDPLDWGDPGENGLNVYQELWVRRCRWLLEHSELMTPPDWKRMYAGSKARYLRLAAKDKSDAQ